MLLENRLGEDPLKDGVLVYRLCGQSTSSSFNWSMEWADARVVLVTIRPQGAGTMLSMRLPLFRRGINLALTGTSAGIFGSAGTWSGYALGSGLAGLTGIASMAALVTTAGVGALAGGALGVATYRRLYRHVVREGAEAIEGFMSAIAFEAERPALIADQLRASPREDSHEE